MDKVVGKNGENGEKVGGGWSLWSYVKSSVLVRVKMVENTTLCM